jgi:hypothetical protein
MTAGGKARLQWLVPLLAFLLIFSGYVRLCVLHNRSLAPTEGAKTLETFSKAMPPPLYLRVGKAQGKEHLVWRRR